jgi:hypothetical protein
VIGIDQRATSASGCVALGCRVQQPQIAYRSVVHDPEAVQHVSVKNWRVSGMLSHFGTAAHTPSVSVHVTPASVGDSAVETVWTSCMSEDVDTASPGSTPVDTAHAPNASTTLHRAQRNLDIMTSSARW